MDISVLPETKTLVFSIFSLREIWKTLCTEGPGFARALWFPPFAVLLLLVCSWQCRQFVDISDDDLVKFSKGNENENENTAKKTEYDVRSFRGHLDTIQKRRGPSERKMS